MTTADSISSLRSSSLAAPAWASCNILYTYPRLRPGPSWPCVLSPQVSTRPKDVVTIEWKAPAAIELTLSPSSSPRSHLVKTSSPAAASAVTLHAAPKLPSPIAQTSPSVVSTSECTSPSEIALSGLANGTFIGTATMRESASSSSGAESIGVISAGTPHCEWVLSPHATKVPSTSSAPEYIRPALTARAWRCVSGAGHSTGRGCRRVTGVARAILGWPSCPMESSPKVITRPDCISMIR
mmetsp:Transcript_47288/g.94270  ORF Transcript_47288/g.94270 Transcript_47288/m.94270 type:complete len:240 (-) Transcript_47288:388-1107(-)